MSQAVEAYRGITATEEFKYLEILRARIKHDEAQAIYSAEKRGEQRGEKRGEQRGEERANAKWQGVVAGKDAENERLRKELKELRSQIGKNN